MVLIIRHVWHSQGAETSPEFYEMKSEARKLNFHSGTVRRTEKSASKFETAAAGWAGQQIASPRHHSNNVYRYTYTSSIYFLYHGGAHTDSPR